MDCARNIITANFSGGGTSATTAPLWQWDYGQVLCITGIDLPAAFEVHFSTNRTGGVSTVAVGADGQVTIPNELLTIGKNLNAWIYLSDAQGEGETEYSILIPVKARPMPETYDAEVTGEFDDIVRQVSEYAETAQTAADNAGASASAAATSASEAAASASAAESAKTAAETAKNAAETAQGNAEDAQAAAETAAQTATEKAQQTAQDAAQAALDAGRAESAAGRAEAAETGAEDAKTDAETAAQGAADSASAASASATSAGQSATSAGQSATAAAGSATTAQGAAQTATAKAGEASASATAAAASETAAQTAQQGAEAAKDTAVANATTATTKAAEAAQSATDAAASETAAEAAATRAERAAATLTVDDALSDTSVNPVQNKVITEGLTQLKNALDALKITDTASGAIASFPDGAAMPVEGLTVEMSPIQEGSGDPSPDNVRPISGRDSVTVWRTGINVWDEEWKVVGDHIASKNPIPCMPGTAYYMSAPEQPSNGLKFYTKSMAQTGSTRYNAGLFTTPSDCYYMTFEMTNRYGTTYNHDISINYPSTDHDYHAYNGQSVTIQLGQTVYGGTLDVTAGKLTVDRAMTTVGDLAWDIAGVGKFYSITLQRVIKVGSATYGYDNAISDCYEAKSIASISSLTNGGMSIDKGGNVQLRDDRYKTASEFKTAMANATIVYELAVPLEITLDPDTLSTLKGQNNVLSDGDSVTVDYVADPKLYIDKKITAAVAALA